MAWRDDFESLKVTACLRAGVVSDQWLPLDGILLYQAYRDKLGPQVATLPGGGVGVGLDPASMPLAVHNAGTPFWFYACSFAQPQPWWIAEGRDYWNKRFDTKFSDLVDFGGKRGKIVVEQGPYRAYHMPVFYRVALRIEWYCVGHRESILRLLSTVTHVGKKRVQGWGRVAEWIVESWPEDWSVWRDGTLTRAVPGAMVAGKGAFDFMNYGYRPPYYMRENQMMVAMPGRECF